MLIEETDDDDGEEKPTIGDLLGGLSYKMIKKWSYSMTEYKAVLNDKKMKSEEAKELIKKLDNV